MTVLLSSVPAMYRLPSLAAALILLVAVTESSAQAIRDRSTERLAAPNCTFAGIDFSTLTHHDGATDYAYSSSDNHYTWYDSKLLFLLLVMVWVNLRILTGMSTFAPIQLLRVKVMRIQALVFHQFIIVWIPQGFHLYLSWTMLLLRCVEL